QNEEPPKTEPKGGSIWDKLPSLSLEMTVTIGPQAGVTVGEIAKADLTVAGFELMKDKTTLNEGGNGELKSEKKLGTMKMTSDTDGVSSESMKVTNKAGISLFGFGVEGGQEQRLDGSDYKSFTKVTGKDGNMFSSVKEETDISGNTTVKQESGFTL